MPADLLKFLWPTIEQEDPSEASRHRLAYLDALGDVRRGGISCHEGLALAEARMISAAEADRRIGTEGKASTCLLVIAAMVPILTYLEGAVWDRKAGTAPKGVTTFLLLCGVAYLVSAARHASRALDVARIVCIGPSDVLGACTRDDAAEAERRMAILHLEVALRNQSDTNCKVDAVQMAQQHLLRAFMAFGILLAVEAAWELGDALAHAIGR